MQHHGAALRALDHSELAEELAGDWDSAHLEPDLRALLEYSVALTERPHSIREADLDRLRQAGYTDEAILHACEVASYYNFVNRMADGLGVALEPDWPHPLIGPWTEADPGSATPEERGVLDGGGTPEGD